MLLAPKRWPEKGVERVFADDEILLQAVIWYTEKNVDFIEAYNAAWILQQGMNTVSTFDQKHFKRFEGITVIVPGE